MRNSLGMDISHDGIPVKKIANSLNHSNTAPTLSHLVKKLHLLKSAVASL
jgi:hypothetical protein